jgi:hypothetical protein
VDFSPKFLCVSSWTNFVTKDVDKSLEGVFHF